MARHISQFFPDLGDAINQAGDTVIERTIQGDVNNSAGDTVLNVGDSTTEATIEADVVHNDGTIIVNVGDTNSDATYLGDVVSTRTDGTQYTVINNHFLIDDGDGRSPGSAGYVTTYGTSQAELDLIDSNGNVIVDVSASSFNGRADRASNVIVNYVNRNDMGAVIPNSFTANVTRIETMTVDEYEALMMAGSLNDNTMYMLTDNAITT